MGREPSTAPALSYALLGCFPGLTRSQCPAGAGAWLEDAVKKLLILLVLALSGFAVWRKIQADRAELNLWTEATTADE